MEGVDRPGRSYTGKTPPRCGAHGRSRRIDCSAPSPSSLSTWPVGYSGPISFSAFVISVTIDYKDKGKTGCALCHMRE